MCHANGKGYNLQNLQNLGYQDQIDFLYGKSLDVSQYGWKSREKKTVEETFNFIYNKPLVEDIISSDSFMKVNGSIREPLKWVEVPMVHPEGRCLRLEYGKTEYKETTLIMKFTNITFRGSLELSITG